MRGRAVGTKQIFELVVVGGRTNKMAESLELRKFRSTSAATSPFSAFHLSSKDMCPNPKESPSSHYDVSSAASSSGTTVDEEGGKEGIVELTNSSFPLPDSELPLFHGISFASPVS